MAFEFHKNIPTKNVVKLPNGDVFLNGANVQMKSIAQWMMVAMKSTLFWKMDDN